MFRIILVLILNLAIFYAGYTIAEVAEEFNLEDNYLGIFFAGFITAVLCLIVNMIILT